MGLAGEGRDPGSYLGFSIHPEIEDALEVLPPTADTLQKINFALSVTIDQLGTEKGGTVLVEEKLPDDRDILITRQNYNTTVSLGEVYLKRRLLTDYILSSNEAGEITGIQRRVTHASSDDLVEHNIRRGKSGKEAIRIVEKQETTGEKLEDQLGLTEVSDAQARKELLRALHELAIEKEITLSELKMSVEEN